MSDETKKCPYCAETISTEAIKCKHCGEFLNKPEQPPQRQESSNDILDKRKIIEHIELIFAAIILIAFFMPWINAGFFSLSGFQLAKESNNLSDMGNRGSSEVSIISYALYLIPVLSLATIIASITKYKRKQFAIYEGFYLIVFMIYCFSVYDDILQAASFGIYLTLIAALLLFFTSIDYSIFSSSRKTN